MYLSRKLPELLSKLKQLPESNSDIFYAHNLFYNGTYFL